MNTGLFRWMRLHSQMLCITAIFSLISLSANAIGGDSTLLHGRMTVTQNLGLQKKDKPKFHPKHAATFLTVNVEQLAYYQSGKFFQPNNMAYGFKFGTMKNSGWFISGMTNFNFQGAFKLANPMQCDRTTQTNSYLEAMFGLTGRYCRPISFHFGAGYFQNTNCYKMYDGNWGHVWTETAHGPIVAAGFMFHIYGFALSIEGVVNYNLNTPSFSQGFGYGAKVGLGFCLESKKKQQQDALKEDDHVAEAPANRNGFTPLTDIPVNVEGTPALPTLSKRQLDSLDIAVFLPKAPAYEEFHPEPQPVLPAEGMTKATEPQPVVIPVVTADTMAQAVATLQETPDTLTQAVVTTQETLDSLAQAVASRQETLDSLAHAIASRQETLDSLAHAAVTPQETPDTLKQAVATPQETPAPQPQPEVAQQETPVVPVIPVVIPQETPAPQPEPDATPQEAPAPELPCGEQEVKDIDGNVYHTVLIAGQCWTKENLRTTKFSDGSAISLGTQSDNQQPRRYYPNGDPQKVERYGYLYNWMAASHESSDARLCPAGWHVPSSNEWTILISFLNTQSKYTCGNTAKNVAKTLASKEAWELSDAACAIGNETAQNDLTGFSALPAGAFFNQYGFFTKGTWFWSTTKANAQEAYCIYLLWNEPAVTGDDKEPVASGFSVRCLKD